MAFCDTAEALWAQGWNLDIQFKPGVKGWSTYKLFFSLAWTQAWLKRWIKINLKFKPIGNKGLVMYNKYFKGGPIHKMQDKRVDGRPMQPFYVFIIEWPTFLLVTIETFYLLCLRRHLCFSPCPSPSVLRVLLHQCYISWWTQLCTNKAVWDLDSLKKPWSS